MVRIVFVFILFFLLFIAGTASAQQKSNDASTPPSSSAKSADTVLATAINNGSGRRKSGGRSPYLALSDLKDSDTLNFTVAGGNFSYLTVHGRTSYGGWSVLYRGANKPLQVGHLLKNRRSRYTHLIVSVNGEHERYQRRSCKLEVRKAEAAVKSPPKTKAVDPPATPAENVATTQTVLATAINNGSGRRKSGGSSPYLALSDLKDSDTLNFTVAGGNFSYLTVHGRTSYGGWSVLYRGANKPLQVGHLLKNRRSRYTHLIVSVNGEHERYQRRSCKLEVRKAEANKPRTPKPQVNAPQAIAPPINVVRQSNATTPSVAIKASTAFNTDTQGSGQTFVDLKIHFNPDGSVSINNGTDKAPAQFRNAAGQSIPTPSEAELKSQSWQLKPQKENGNWVLARTTHF